MITSNRVITGPYLNKQTNDKLNQLFSDETKEIHHKIARRTN